TALHLTERSQHGVEPAQGRDLEHGVRFSFPHSRFPKLGRYDVFRDPLALVDRLECGRQLRFRNALPNSSVLSTRRSETRAWASAALNPNARMMSIAAAISSASASGLASPMMSILS